MAVIESNQPVEQQVSARKVESSDSLWSEAFLGGAGIGAGFAALSILFVGPLGLKPWFPVIVFVCAGMFGFCASVIFILLHHRGLLGKWVNAFEVASGVDLNKDGQVGKSSKTRMAYMAQAAPDSFKVEDAASASPEEADYADRLDFGFFVDQVWPRKGSSFGMAIRAWTGRNLPSGRNMTPDLLREYIQRCERCNLVMRAGKAANSPWVRSVTSRKQALAALHELVILRVAE